MSSHDGDRPEGAPPPPKPKPNPGPPRGSALDDPANLIWCNRMVQISLQRQGLTLDDLEVPERFREPVAT